MSPFAALKRQAKLPGLRRRKMSLNQCNSDLNQQVPHTGFGLRRLREVLEQHLLF